MSITVYSRTTCAPCKAVKQWLTKKNFTFIEKNLDENPAYGAEAYSKSGFQMVPIIEVDDQIISGMNFAHLSRALNL